MDPPSRSRLTLPTPLQFLRQSLRRCGVVLIGAGHHGVRYLDHGPITAFDDVLLRIFPELHGLRFIQIGANDGYQADPLRPFLDRYEWSGLMFEPLKANFTALQRHRGANPRVKLRQAAIDVVSGRRIVYDLAPAATATLPHWTRGLGSFSRARLEQVTRELNLPDAAIVEEEVETISWDQVWKEFGAHHCDLLVLDTEGYDLTLLRAAGLAAHRPRLILFEHACDSIADRLKFYGELIELGYEIATTEGDTVAHLPLTR